MADSEILRPEPPGTRARQTRPTHHETVIAAFRLTAYSHPGSRMRHKPGDSQRQAVSRQAQPVGTRGDLPNDYSQSPIPSTSASTRTVIGPGTKADPGRRWRPAAELGPAGPGRAIAEMAARNWPTGPFARAGRPQLADSAARSVCQRPAPGTRLYRPSATRRPRPDGSARATTETVTTRLLERGQRLAGPKVRSVRHHNHMVTHKSPPKLARLITASPWLPGPAP